LSQKLAVQLAYLADSVDASRAAVLRGLIRHALVQLHNPTPPLTAGA
jgi:hypothetical protein